MQCKVTRRQEEEEIKKKKGQRERNSSLEGRDESQDVMQRGRVKSRREGSRGGREGDVERDILLPARAKIISPGLVWRNVQAD